MWTLQKDVSLPNLVSVGKSPICKQKDRRTEVNTHQEYINFMESLKTIVLYLTILQRLQGIQNRMQTVHIKTKTAFKLRHLLWLRL